MSYYKIKYSKNAEKFIKKHKIEGIRFLKAFTEISQEKKQIKEYDIRRYYSSEHDDLFRLRIGKYRAIFRIIEKEILIFVFDIDSRGDIYKK